MALKTEKKKKLLPIPIRGQREEVGRTYYPERIQGPIFGWPFPILNAVLQFLTRLRDLREPRMRRSRVTLVEFVRDREGRVLQIVGTEKDI